MNGDIINAQAEIISDSVYYISLRKTMCIHSLTGSEVD